MLENNKNLTCDFAEELVSYLYDELANSNKARFEKHLKTCSHCEKELLEFSNARSSILEWRNEEFEILPTPLIEIPFEKKAKQSENATISRPWFASIRELFSLSPAWMTATTAFAALAICLGLFAVVISSLRNGPDVAGVENNNIKIVPSPTTDISNKNSNNSNSNQAQTKSGNSPEPDLTTVQKSTGSTEPLKISSGSNPTKPQNLNIKKPVQPKINDKSVKPTTKTNKQKAPSLIEEDEEEDTLRLSDLLEQIGMD